MSGMRRRDLAVALLGLLAAWELAARALDRPVLPGVAAVLAALAREGAGPLAAHAGASLLRVLGGIALAAGAAAPLGLWTALSARTNRVVTPVLYALYPVPKIVLVPVILLLFGVGEAPKVLLIALILFGPVFVLVRDSAAAVRPELVLSVRSLGAGRAGLWRWVYVPAALPALFSALRQSSGTALAVLYVAELTATHRGLGYYIYLNGATLMDYPAMYAGIVVMSALGAGLFLAADALEKRLCPWARPGPGASA